jgi:hypothetical protein
MKKRNFEHKECGTSLTDVTPKEAVNTKCWKCHKRFLQPEDYVKMSMEEKE